MEKIGVIRNSEKVKTESIALEITDYLKMKGRQCFVTDDGTALPPDCECALVLGGDGTLLRAAKAAYDRQLPLLGVNLGTLGYLAEIDTRTLFSALDRLTADEFTIEKRMMLTGTVFHRGEKVMTDVALNDIVVGRSKQLRTFRFLISVNGEYMTAYSADGVIVSTATGSTGYNLSVGGPIVSPSAELSVLTPIASHSLISRSIVFPGTDEISVKIGTGRTGIEDCVAAVRFDGGDGVPVGTGDSVEIRKSSKYTNIIKINNISFLEVLRGKMADS